MIPAILSFKLFFVAILLFSHSLIAKTLTDQISCDSSLTLKVNGKEYKPIQKGKLVRVNIKERDSSYFEVLGTNEKTLKIYPWGGIHWDKNQKDFKISSDKHSWIRVENKGLVICQKDN